MPLSRLTTPLTLAAHTLLGRLGRSLLLAGAVACASALVVAVSCAITSAQATLESELTRVLGKADARIIHSTNGRFESSWIETVRNWPGVSQINPQLSGSLTLIRKDRRIYEDTGELMRITPDALGVDFQLQDNFQHIALREGALPTTPDEIIIDPMTARWLDASPGTMLEVQRFGDPIEFKVAGIYERVELGLLQRAEIMLDRALLESALGHEDELSRILLILEPNIDVQDFCDLHKAELNKHMTLEPAEMARAGFDRRLQASRYGLIVSAVMTFMAASFIIVTGLTTSVTERQRELAVLRCVGASRTQLFAGQLLVGIFYSIVGVVVGIPLGAAIAAAIVGYFREVLPAGFAWSALGIWLAIAGALAAGLFGALFPAVTASRVAPLQAMTRQARPPRSAAVFACIVAGLILITIQIALMLTLDRDARVYSYFYVGLPFLYLGYFLLATPLLLLLTKLLGPVIAAAFRLPADVVTGSITRSRFRYGFTAGALMVGMSTLTADWSTAKSILHGWVDKIQFADGFALRYTALNPAEQKKISELPFVTQTCPIGYLPLQVFDQQVFGIEGIGPPNVICFGFDPDVFFDINAVEWIQGDPATAIPHLKQGDSIIVADRFLVARNIGVGDTLTLGQGDVKKQFEIVGVVSSVGLDIATQIFGIRSEYAEFAVSGVFMDFRTVAENYDYHDANILQVDFDDTMTEEQATRLIEAAVPGVDFKSGKWITDTINQAAVALLAVQSTVAFIAVMLACIAMANVMMAAIHGRRHEYGLLRAVGAHRTMLARIIFSEVLLVAITAGFVGITLGLHLARVGNIFYRDLGGIDVPMVYPVAPASIGWIVMILLTLLAVTPAVRKLMRSQPALLLSAGRND